MDKVAEYEMFGRNLEESVWKDSADEFSIH